MFPRSLPGAAAIALLMGYRRKILQHEYDLSNWQSHFVSKEAAVSWKNADCTVALAAPYQASQME